MLVKQLEDSRGLVAAVDRDHPVATMSRPTSTRWLMFSPVSQAMLWPRSGSPTPMAIRASGRVSRARRSAVKTASGHGDRAAVGVGAGGRGCCGWEACDRAAQGGS